MCDDLCANVFSFSLFLFSDLLSSILRDCKGIESLHVTSVWWRPLVGHVIGKKLVCPILTRQDVLLAELQLPDALRDAPLELEPHLDEPQDLEDEGLPMQGSGG